MSNNLITYAFVAGELSPTLFGRSDLEKYDLGLETCLNYFVDYRGGISTRPGTEFFDYVEDDNSSIRLIPFQFAPNVANTYVILIYAGGIRFIQDGAYVLEADKAITDITQALPGVVTAAGHGFSTGDWVKISDVVGMTRLNGQTFRVGATTANTFELIDPLTNFHYNTSNFNAYSSGGTVARIYTVSHSLTAAQIEELHYHQVRDTIRLTHTSMDPQILTRSGNTSWSLATETFGPDIDEPDRPSVSNSAIGSAEMIFGVTAVNAEGEESAQSELNLDTNSVDYTTTAGFAAVSWNIVADAVRYNIYRSRIVDGGGLTLGEQLGYLGTSFGTKFVDNNIIPDFTRTPPQFTNPFATKSIVGINVTASGSGYDENDTISISGGGGSGFRGVLIVSAGKIVAVQIINPGSGYSSPVATITTSAGTGATFAIEVGPGSGTYPAVSTLFQQRQLYAASLNEPLTIWGSRPGRLSNFDVSRILTDGDAYEFELDSDVISPILHMIANRLGLLVLTQSGIWLLSGGNERAVTPLNAIAEPHTSTGVSKVPPIVLDTDLLYLEDKGRAVRLLGYDELQKAFAGKDMSVLANHLFSTTNQITSWSYAPAPFSLVWARRADGRFLSFTLEKEQNVYAWARHETRGLVEHLLTVSENESDALYMVVKRRLKGRWTLCLERMATRTFRNLEDAFCVDCGLKTGETNPAATISRNAGSGSNVSISATAGVFSAGDVGKVLRMGGGRATITGFNSSTSIQADFDIDVKDTVPIAGGTYVFGAGEWSMDAKFSTVSGLDHLEGQTVKVLVDGLLQTDKVVSGGAITLDAAGSRAIVGLGFRAVAKTLSPTHPQATIEASRKNVKGSAVRLYDTVGLKVGTSLDHLYEVKETAAQTLGMIRGFKHVLVDSPWDESGQTYYVQDNPLPATVLGIVLDLEVGDDTA